MGAKQAETTWITDKNGNRCSVEYWGSREAAQRTLDSLSNCFRCTNCYNCYNCTRCADCAGCADCYDCSGCTGCAGCSGCADCTDCSDCTRCADCAGCFRCTGCYDCTDCSGLKNGPNPAETIRVPVIPNIHRAIYEAVSQPKALDMTSWHTCKTTHCRAGWVVTLAGEAGRKLEQRFGTLLAAMKIYDASDPSFKINPCRFFDSDEDALADMKRLASSEEASEQEEAR